MKMELIKMFNKNIKFCLCCYEDDGEEILREYETVKQVLDDIMFKDPAYFFIGEVAIRQGYTLNMFKRKFGNKN